MATVKQIEANRANAAKSTGPRTVTGKAKSAANAVTHGLLARSALLPDENADEFAAFSQGLFAALEPEGALEESFVERIVGLLWRLKRVPRLEAALFRVGEITQRLDEERAAVRDLEADAQGRALDSEISEAFNKKPMTPILRQLLKMERFGLDEEWLDARGRVSNTEAELRENLSRLGTTFSSRLAEFTSLSRYEGNMQRNLTNAIHELERLQAARTGAAVAPPVAIDVSLS